MDYNYPAVGFRFYPTEEELISFYLHHKLQDTGPDLLDRIVPIVNIYRYNPPDLPRLAGELCGQESDQCFFFVPRQEREARGGRPNRLTNHGYWKTSGSPCYVYSSQNRKIGRKRTMVYYTGRAPHGKKTLWKMNEYKAIIESPVESIGEANHHLLQLREELSLCRIYKKSKCLRSAFDRRPRPDEVTVRQPYVHCDDAATNIRNHQHNPRTLNAYNSLSEDLLSDSINSRLWDWERELINWFDK